MRRIRRSGSGALFEILGVLFRVSAGNHLPKRASAFVSQGRDALPRSKMGKLQTIDLTTLGRDLTTLGRGRPYQTEARRFSAIGTLPASSSPNCVLAPPQFVPSSVLVWTELNTRLRGWRSPAATDFSQLDCKISHLPPLENRGGKRHWSRKNG